MLSWDARTVPYMAVKPIRVMALHWRRNDGLSRSSKPSASTGTSFLSARGTHYQARTNPVPEGVAGGPHRAASFSRLFGARDGLRLYYLRRGESDHELEPGSRTHPRLHGSGDSGTTGKHILHARGLLKRRCQPRVSDSSAGRLRRG